MTADNKVSKYKIHGLFHVIAQSKESGRRNKEKNNERRFVYLYVMGKSIIATHFKKGAIATRKYKERREIPKSRASSRKKEIFLPK